mmetsp:Transcript_10940/g.24442  ORF Transcript_10940/g.24442 Transcript_10940/m.24442 type:complete len:92 (-) Transcript_10940:373-648(-)
MRISTTAPSFGAAEMPSRPLRAAPPPFTEVEGADGLAEGCAAFLEPPFSAQATAAARVPFEETEWTGTASTIGGGGGAVWPHVLKLIAVEE